MQEEVCFPLLGLFAQRSIPALDVQGNPRTFRERIELGFKKEATCLSNLKFMARRMYG